MGKPPFMDDFDLFIKSFYFVFNSFNGRSKEASMILSERERKDEAVSLSQP